MTSVGDYCYSTIFVKYFQYTFHTVMLHAVFGSFATDFTTMVLIAFDWCYNEFVCYNIVKMQMQNSDLLDQQIDSLQELALCDVVESHAPLGFILVFLRA